MISYLFPYCAHDPTCRHQGAEVGLSYAGQEVAPSGIPRTQACSEERTQGRWRVRTTKREPAGNKKGAYSHATMLEGETCVLFLEDSKRFLDIRLMHVHFQLFLRISIYF